MNGSMPNIFQHPVVGTVRYTTELARIAALPRRWWTTEEAQALALEMTDILRTSKGTMILRPVQAIALYELLRYRRLFASMAVGAGKTLVSLLAAEVLNVQRAVLLVPAKLLEKTERDRRELAHHWRLERLIRPMSYEWLGQPHNAEALEDYKPDAVLADEAHKLRNTDAAVTRRVRRFFASSRVPFGAMSGTMTKRSLLDFAHLMRWVFAVDLEHMPMPRTQHELEIWGDAIDERKAQQRRADPGALECLLDDEERERWKFDRRGAVRSGFRRRMIDTAGIVATTESPVDATLAIEGVEPPQPEPIEMAFRKLRNEWRTPDDWPLADAIQVRRHALEMSLGMFYVWDPRPPELWLEKRKAWAKFCRKVLSHSKKLDTEAQVRMVMEAEGDCTELIEWLKVRDMFEPNTKPVWLTDVVLKFAADWARREKGIVWVEHVVFGERLEKDFGIPYYGKKGMCRTGRFIDDHPHDEPMAASIASNGEGRNLQAWNKNLVTSWPPNGKGAEQLLGRTHRPGQEAGEVYVELFVSCAEHVLGFWQSMNDSQYVFGTTGSPQKLLLASTNVAGFDVLSPSRKNAPGMRARWDKDFRED